MAVILKYQFADGNPDEFVTFGEVNLDEAISKFYDFDWVTQRKICNERELQNLSFSQPTFLLFKNVNEILLIDEFSDLEYHLTYKNGGKISEDLVAFDLTKNPYANTVEEIISSFFEGMLEAEFKEEEDFESSLNSNKIPESEIGKYNLKKYYSIFLWLLVPIASLIAFTIIDGKVLNKSQLVSFFIISYIAILILHIPFLIILYQYLSKPIVLKLKFSNETKDLTLFFQDNIIQIKRNEISQLVFTEARKSGRYYTKLMSLKNIVLTKKNGHQYFLTSMTFSDSELNFILKLLSLHYYHFEKNYPILVTNLLNKSGERLNKNFAKGESLEEKYSQYSETQLKNIVENPNDYQPIAIKVAKNILKLMKFKKDI